MESDKNSKRLIDGALWLIRLRWMAIAGILVATKFSSGVLHISIQEMSLYMLAAALFIFNGIAYLGIRQITREQVIPVFIHAKNILYFQICSDLIVLTCLLHFSGGVENPFIVYYIFHMIICSILLSARECFLITSFALLLIGLMAFLEFHEIVPHYDLIGFYTHSFYQNKVYLIGTGFIFITTSYMVVYMTSSISSKLRRQEEAYRLANLELENKDTIKNEYVLRLTHDIKGHIAAVQNIIKASLVAKTEEEKRDFVTQALQRSRSLMSFVRDLLKLTTLRLQDKLEMSEFSLRESLEKLLQEFKVNCPENISIHANITEVAESVFGNQLSIEEALSNIIANAIKYSPGGGTVEIDVRKHQDYYTIDISDKGLGIPRKEQKLIFNEFYRASNVRKMEKGSSGFGLSLVKQIVDMHHGKLSIESEEDQGTRVIMRLPLHHSEKKKTGLN